LFATRDALMAQNLLDIRSIRAGRAPGTTDTTQQQGYFPLDQALLDTADAVLHVRHGAAATRSEASCAPAPVPGASTDREGKDSRAPRAPEIRFAVDQGASRRS
jgi:hypothetical protein